tara:strand:- start:415 stop:624 length:210 start_codon:yes stop_codon:yes gene_type:complete
MSIYSEKIEAGKQEIQTLSNQIAQYDQARNDLQVRLLKWQGVVEFLEGEEKEQESTQASTEEVEEQAPQ